MARGGGVGVDTIDAWRERLWGRLGTCPCGDPIILADTEDWDVPRCFDCWSVMTAEDRAKAERESRN
jgi:hypothetical protein